MPCHCYETPASLPAECTLPGSLEHPPPRPGLMAVVPLTTSELTGRYWDHSCGGRSRLVRALWGRPLPSRCWEPPPTREWTSHQDCILLTVSGHRGPCDVQWCLDRCLDKSHMLPGKVSWYLGFFDWSPVEVCQF